MSWKTKLPHWLYVTTMAFVLAVSVGMLNAEAYAEGNTSTAQAQTSVALTAGSTELGATADEPPPPEFDLRDVNGRNYVTPVKFQNPFGTCWGFAAIAAAETSILGSHYADDPLAYEKLDLSEKQLAFFAHSHVDDPANSQYGEGIYSTKYTVEGNKLVVTEPLTSEDYYTGGTPFLATNTFAAGSGPTLESRSDALKYKGKNGTIISLGDGTPYCYSPDDDWTLGEEYRSMQDFVLKESYLLPTPAVWTKEGYDVVYSYDEQATIAIKEQLQQLRAVVIGFYADESRPWDTGSGLYMNCDHWAHYTYSDPVANHAVTIVGWNDNYPAEYFTHDVYQLREDSDFTYKPSNFKTDENGKYVVDEDATAATTPPANGAWLVKNSWGSGEQDFPNCGGGDWGVPIQVEDESGEPLYDENDKPVTVGSGYFWLSYYDQSIVWPEVFIFDTAVTGDRGIYDQSTLHCNQYDLMPVTAMQAKQSDKLVKSANVFTSENGEHVMCASYITDTPNTTVTVEVYLLNDDFASPEDGVLAGSHTDTREYAGFYIDYLNGIPVDIQPGQSYSVVITQRQDAGKGQYAVDYPTNFGPMNLAIQLGLINYWAYAVQNNESFLYYNDVWKSWADEEVRNDFLELYEDAGMGEGVTLKDLFAYVYTMQYDNFPIKTYAFDRREDVFVRLAGGTDKLYVCKGDNTATATLEVYGEDSNGLTIADFANENGIEIIDWSLENDGSERIIEIEPSKDGTQAQIKGLAVGIAHVVANIKGVGRVIIPVEVREHKWGTPTYTWAEDNSTVTAKRVCEYDASHVETETVVPTSKTTKKPTTKATGKAVLTATFKNPAFETQTKTVTLPKLEASEADDSSKTTAAKTGSATKTSTVTTGSTTPKAGDSTPLAILCFLGATGLAVALVARRKLE